MSEPLLLVCNIGSSSLKAGLYDRGGQHCLGHITVAALGRSATIESRGMLRSILSTAPSLPPDSAQDAAIDWLLEALASSSTCSVSSVGHRVVHGGSHYSQPVRIDEAVLDQLQQLCPLAPNHQPHNLAAIRAVAQRWPTCPQVACFDTAFHAGQPRPARLFALPRSQTDAGVIRYGFHGLSYASIARRLPEYLGERADGRVIVAHLGHGASLCAMQARRSVATTMGMTALDGLMMGRRCGAIDPGALLYLLRQRGMSAADLDTMLNEQSGLLGVSGISDDVRELEASDSKEAAEALALFAYRAGREIGSMAAALGGLDALVFTAGIGEHSAAMRAAIGARASWLGIDLDLGLNSSPKALISKGSSPVSVLVIATDEEGEIARQTAAASAASG
ncbi:MAG: acetate/propionate family kinase [Rhodanobacteraceae bacterium]